MSISCLSWKMQSKATAVITASIFLKFMLFNLIWCAYTTFTPFSHIESYTTALIGTLILGFPYACFRRWELQLVLLFLTDLLFIANLMYYRTYYTAIPLDSYTLIGNLADFTQSVYDSVRWYDLIFPLSTLATAFLHRRIRQNEKAVRPNRTAYVSTCSAACIVLVLLVFAKGGFRKSYSAIKYSAHLYASGTVMYTLFENLYYDYLEGKPDLTPEKEKEIDRWLCQQPAMPPLPPEAGERSNCIVILVESLESWVLEQNVEGREITPCLNRLLKEPQTLYAPHVLTQVKGGRSIDGQLLLCTGLLPINSGTYSVLYPNHTYYSLQKALKAKYHTRNYLLTVDKKKTWNQEAIAHSFGIDTLLSYPDFQLTEAFGNRKRVGDGSFFAQCQEKMKNEEVWRNGETVYMQLVTYSGHSPFHMPDELKQISFSPAIPKMMNDYMTVVNYTDRAIGKFIDYLKTRPEYAETIIVITGDHEGLASYRNTLCNSSGGAGIVSDKPFTPFIVVNSPVGLRYEKVMGQVDMYPTLLNLLRLDNYLWKGIGQSILDPNKKDLAVGSQMNVEGQNYTPEDVRRAKEAYEISDMIIRGDYWKKEDEKRNEE